VSHLQNSPTATGCFTLAK